MHYTAHTEIYLCTEDKCSDITVILADNSQRQSSSLTDSTNVCCSTVYSVSVYCVCVCQLKLTKSPVVHFLFLCFSLLFPVRAQ